MYLSVTNITVWRCSTFFK